MKNRIHLELVCVSLFIGFALFTVYSFAQTKIYIPRNILEAYKRGTRSFDGKPGPNYWQNSSDYKINVSVDPVTRLVSGTENIVYHNNSPDSLPYIVFRLYQDMNKPDAARNSELDEKSITEGDILDEIKVNNTPIDINSASVKVKDTNLYLYLDEPVPAKSSINFYFKWHFIIPGGNNPRMGMYDSTSFFIGYWYPQVAVYDDIDGWDKYNYTGTQEFYNDFSNFNIEINVPNKFGVWGTGTLQNPDEVLNHETLKKYNEAQVSDSVVRIVTEQDIEKGNIYSDKNTLNTWHFKADSVTDFAFGMSNHYLWDGVGLKVSGKNNSHVYIASVYRVQSKDFHNVCKIARDAINYYSTVLPGVPFPYPSMTVFNGHSGGMEYPMIVNDGSYKGYYRTVYVTSHEISHTYFPFYMGINERKYAWMDEGMATFIPYEFQLEEGKADLTARDAFLYSKFAGNETDMPPITPSVFLENMPYTIASYMRPGLAYYYLEDALGKDEFTRIVQEYIKRWHGKHPLPYDFFFTFDNVYGKNLSWYWLPWFFEKVYPDLGIKKVKLDNNNVEILIKKDGNVPIPVYIQINGNGDQNTSIYRSAKIWESGSDSIWIDKKVDFKPTKILLGNKDIPDVNLANNVYEINDYNRSSEDSENK